MPQGPFPVFLQNPGGNKTALYCNAPTVIKNGPGSVISANVLVAGAAGAVYDCIGSANAKTANQIAVIPAAAGPLEINFPCLVGITYLPGASQVTSFSYQ